MCTNLYVVKKIAVPNDPSTQNVQLCFAKSTPITARQISMGNCVLNELSFQKQVQEEHCRFRARGIQNSIIGK